MNPIIAAAHHTGLLRLAVRLLSSEIDTLLYRQMVNADAHTRDGHRPLADPELAARPEAETPEELATEFRRLFIGPQPECPPYASAHLGEVSNSADAPHRASMPAWNATNCVPFSACVIVGHDHLAVQLSLLAHLYSIAVGTADSHLTAERAWRAAHGLLHVHLSP